MHKIINATKTIILALVLSFGLSYVYAWTAPTSNPPAGNVSAPINTSATLQQKSGDFTVSNFIANTMTIGGTINANAITAPQFCIGASCISAWSAVGGSGTVTSLSAGTGITLTPNPITTTGTISANTAVIQSRVSGSCAIGQAITAIAADGTVTCKAATGTQASSAWSDFVGRRTTAQNIYGWVANVTDYYELVTATTLEAHQVTNGVDTLLYTACDTTKTQNTANSPLVSTGMTGTLSCHVLYGGVWYDWQLTPVGIREYGNSAYYFWPWQ